MNYLQVSGEASGPPQGEALSPYRDRTIEPRLTVERLRPHFPALGITRVARQTGLDRTGIPCYAAFRPAALTLSTTQGKGVTDEAAMASAAMEAAEFAIAENPGIEVVTARPADLPAVFNPRRLMPRGTNLPDAPMRWVRGTRWPDGGDVYVPLDAVTLGGDPADLPGICRNSNGLASGNTFDEAIFHALCELIERDATALWSLKRDGARRATEIDPDSFDDPVVDELRRGVADAGLTLRLFDQTTDLGVPCVFAVVGEEAKGEAKMFDLAAGYGCHPVGVRAAIRAITEAAQTRVTNIAGARDDFFPTEYDATRDAESTAFLDGAPDATIAAPAWLPLGTKLPDLLAALGERLRGRADVAFVELGGARYGISVVRAISFALEDRDANHNWRPGKRALAALLAP